MVICGDLLNMGIPSSVSSVFDEVLTPAQSVDKAVELLQPIADRILGGVGGNHEQRAVKTCGLDPLYQVFCMLRNSGGESLAPLYRQDFAFMRIVLQRGNSKSHYALMLLHGKTEAKRKQFDFAVEGVDAIIGGHTHEPSARKGAKLVLTSSNNVIVKPFVSLTACSWLNYGGYAARGLFKPTANSDPQALELEFAGTNNRRGRVSVVW